MASTYIRAKSSLLQSRLVHLVRFDSRHTCRERLLRYDIARHDARSVTISVAADHFLSSRNAQDTRKKRDILVQFEKAETEEPAYSRE